MTSQSENGRELNETASLTELTRQEQQVNQGTNDKNR